MMKPKLQCYAVILLLGWTLVLPGGHATAQTLQLSKNADFSTADGYYTFSDTLHARVAAHEINYLELDTNNYRLHASEGEQAIEGSFANLLNGTYVAHIPLSNLHHEASSWQFRAEIKDRSHGEFKSEVNVWIQEAPGIGDTLSLTARIEARGEHSLVLSGNTVYVDNLTVIRENGLPLSFMMLQNNWKVLVIAQRRNDGKLWALYIDVLERDTSGQKVETRGVIAGIVEQTVTVNNIAFVVVNNTEIIGKNGQLIHLADLRVGMLVEARGARNSSNQVIAERIAVVDDVVGGDEIELTGHITALIVDSTVAGNLSIRAIGVNQTLFEVTGETEIFGFENERIEFSDLHVGELVQVYARTRTGNLPLALRIKREDENGDEVQVRGIITALGDSSVTVNELRFRVISTTIILNDENHFVPFSSLSTGLTVEVRANRLSNNTLVATRIKIEDEPEHEIELKGFIEALTDNSLTVRGKTFLVDDATQIINDNGSPASFSALRVGLLVQVHGTFRAEGHLYASLIKIENFFTNEVELRGVITALGADNLVVTGITFFVDANTEIIGRNGQLLTFGELQVGMVVEIHATRQNDRWLAKRIQVEDRIDSVVEVFGRIDSLASDSFFMFARRFLVTNTTIFVDEQLQALTFGDLRVGDFVKVRAQILADSALVALRVQRQSSPSENFEFTGSINALSFQALIVDNFVLIVNQATVYLDPNEQPIQITDLHLGMVVEVTANKNENGRLVATRVKVEQRRSVSGVISGIGDNTVVVLGIEHILTSLSEIYDEQNRPASPSAIKVGQQVEIVAQGSQSAQLEVVTLRIIYSGVITSAPEAPAGTPQNFMLAQNYPNPFNPSTVIRFSLPLAGHARLAIYDVLGRRLRTLVDGMQPAGAQQVTWDGRNEAGASVASGVYFYRLEANGLSQTRKLTLMH